MATFNRDRKPYFETAEAGAPNTLGFRSGAMRDRLARHPIQPPKAGQGRGFGVQAPALGRSASLTRAVDRGATPTTPPLPGRAGMGGGYASPPITVRPPVGGITQPTQTATAGAQLRRGTTLGSFGVEAGDGTAPVQRPTSASGRAMPYGAMRGGVATFSDGSGNIPRTMSDAQIGGLSNGDRVTTIPSANFQRPSIGVANSLATGGQTLELGQGVRRPEAPMFSRQPVNPERRAQLSAQQDAADIASGNMQSAGGRAAANLRRRGDEAGLATLMQGAMQAPALAGAGEQARGAQATDLQRSMIGAGTDLAVAGIGAETARQALPLQRPALQQVMQADGTLALIDPQTGQTSGATLPDGSPVRPAQPMNPQAQRSRDGLQNRLQRSTASYLQQLAPPGQPPSAEHLQQARLFALMTEGIQVEQNEQGQFRAMIDGEWTPL